MEDRSRFMAEAKWACSFFPIRRSTWEEAQKCIRLYGKLLAAFGWVDEGFPSALERVCMTAGNEDGKLTVLFACITGLPFGVARTPCPDQARVAAHMDASLFGLGRVKREIKNHLILAAHAQGAPAPQPLLLVGPPGTGKTAVARVVASALELPLFKASLACAVDTIFFRGSHYGWTASAPGFLSKSLMAAGCENPVILLDEIDKAGGHGHGDVVDTLAEIFDPTQSHCFHDLFLTEVPIDLSRVTWIATANDLARVPAYIADRCRIIQIPQYRERERRVIICKLPSGADQDRTPPRLPRRGGGGRCPGACQSNRIPAGSQGRADGTHRARACGQDAGQRGAARACYLGSFGPACSRREPAETNRLHGAPGIATGRNKAIAGALKPENHPARSR